MLLQPSTSFSQFLIVEQQLRNSSEKPKAEPRAALTLSHCECAVFEIELSRVTPEKTEAQSLCGICMAGFVIVCHPPVLCLLAHWLGNPRPHHSSLACLEVPGAWVVLLNILKPQQFMISHSVL